MLPKYSIGQRVRFTKRCVLASNVPRNTKGYTHMALLSKEGDKYTGAGLIEPGTQAVIVDYAVHGTGAVENPIVRVNGVITRVHQNQVEAF